ncbi:MAG: hypothetical protein H7641_15465 [Candidatus Heimdallarchaeota archaeon]|nr:hypothetical protein [Candidatus Heimdallarchaeota archaeon]MCK4878957.1 hypothetical protein [Candidatus Heimdallarchaeota archaeon]
MEERTEMKYHKGVKFVLLISVIIIGNFFAFDILAQDSVYTSPKSTFVIDSNTNFTVQSAAPLTWDLNQRVNLTIEIEATGLPVGENISIATISIYFNIPEDPHKKYQTSIVPSNNFTELDQVQIFNSSLFAPDDTKEFNITLEFVVFSTSIPENQFFEAEFPGDVEYIEVEEDRTLPIINLPGFPDAQTFSRWIFIFAISFILIAMPSIFVASFKIKDVMRNRSKKGGKKK